VSLKQLSGLPQSALLPDNTDEDPAVAAAAMLRLISGRWESEDIPDLVARIFQGFAQINGDTLTALIRTYCLTKSGIETLVRSLASRLSDAAPAEQFPLLEIISASLASRGSMLAFVDVRRGLELPSPP